MADAVSELIWELRDDPTEIGGMFPGPRLAMGGYAIPNLAAGPTLASPEWWNGVEVSTDQEPLVGVVASVGGKGFSLETADGSTYTTHYRGDRAEYREGRTLELIRAFPPPGFVPTHALDPEGGLLVEIWAR